MNTTACHTRLARRVLIGCVVVATLTGCGSQYVKEVKRIFEPNGEALLRDGMGNYDKKRFPQAAEQFQEALDVGLTEPDQVKAHKYLAFIHCAAKRERQCRAHFRTALELNPEFELEPAEASNPAWGPTFRALKARQDRYRGT